jgi:pimeloyl-ACP methyl ester carboxylesterase
MTTTQFLTQPGGHRLAYDVAGPDGAPLVVCTPGMGDTRKVYRFLAPRLLAAGYRVATMDLRGAGESSTGWADYRSAASAADLLAVARHLGGPVVFLSNSYSAAASVVAAADAPELVAGLAMTGPWVRSPQPPGGIKGLVVRVAGALVGRVAAAWTAYYRSLYRGAKPADLAGYGRDLRATMREPGRLAALRAMIAGGHGDAAARLPGVRCPALIVMGTADPDFPDPTAEARWIEEQLAGSGSQTEVVMVPGCGHYPIAEAPEATAAAVLPFLRKVHGA